MKRLTLKQLKQLNKKSEYNRRFDWCAFYEAHEKACLELQQKSPDFVYRRMNTVVLLSMLICHDYKSGEPCETHYRCQLISALTTKIPMLLFDISIEDYESLDDAPQEHMPSRKRVA